MIKLQNEAISAEPQEVLKHNDALDGVRGVAVSLVVLLHLLSTGRGGFVKEILYKSRSGWWVGVDLFFSLSGFLITGILFDSLRDPHYFRNFYFRRVLRIFPLYYGVILLCLIAWALYPSIGSLRTFVLLAAYLQNTPLWWSRPDSILTTLIGHFWSLAVEEQFYMVWPILIFLVRDRRRLLWVSGGLAFAALLTRLGLVSHGANREAIYHLTICRTDSLLGGAWLALMMRGQMRAKVLRYSTSVFWFAFAACAGMAWACGDFDSIAHRSISIFGYSFVAVGCAALIAMALRPNGLVNRAMHLGVLRFLGRYSYGIYVYHQILFVAFNLFLANELHKHIHSLVLLHLGSAICLAIMTVLVAMMSFHLYEKRFLRLKRFFNYSAV